MMVVVASFDVFFATFFFLFFASAVDADASSTQNPYSYISCDQQGNYRVCYSRQTSTFLPEDLCPEWTVATISTWALSERMGRILRGAQADEAWIGVLPKRVPWAWTSTSLSIVGQHVMPMLELDQQGCWADTTSTTLSSNGNRNNEPLWQQLAGQSQRDLSGPVTFNVTINTCVSQCRDLVVYKYYGIRRGTGGLVTCFCGDSFGTYGPATDCWPSSPSSNMIYRIGGAYSNWALSQPLGDGCAYMSKSQRAWVVGDCFQPRSFICQFADISLCDNAQKNNDNKTPRYFRLAGLCFGVASDSHSMWQDARYTCLAYLGDLPVIMDESTNDLLLSAVQDDFWLALSNIAWVTIENAPLPVTFFDQSSVLLPTQSTGRISFVTTQSRLRRASADLAHSSSPVIVPSPIGRCVTIKQNGQWSIRSCTDQIGGIFCRSVPLPSPESADEAFQELIFSQVAVPVAVVVAYIALVSILGGAICCFCRRRPFPRHILERRNLNGNGYHHSEASDAFGPASSNDTVIAAVTSEPSSDHIHPADNPMFTAVDQQSEDDGIGAMMVAADYPVATPVGAVSMGVIQEQPDAEDEDMSDRERHHHMVTRSALSGNPLSPSMPPHSLQRRDAMVPSTRSPSISSRSSSSSGEDAAGSVSYNGEPEAVRTSCCGCYRLGGTNVRHQNVNNNNNNNNNNASNIINNHSRRPSMMQQPAHQHHRHRIHGSHINYTFTEGQVPPQPNNLGDDDVDADEDTPGMPSALDSFSTRRETSNKTPRMESSLSAAEEEVYDGSGYTSTPDTKPRSINHHEISESSYPNAGKPHSSIMATPISSAFLTPGLSAGSSSARTSPTGQQQEEFTSNTMALRYTLRDTESSGDPQSELLSSFAATRTLISGKLGNRVPKSLVEESRIPPPPPLPNNIPPPPPPPPGPNIHLVSHTQRALEY